MSASEGILESGGMPDPMHVGDSSDVVGRSPMQLAAARFRADKKSMVALGVVVLYLVAAIAAPVLVWLGVLEPEKTHLNLINEISLPAGDWWGISWDHPLGVEPGLGRDVASRLWYGITFSLAISLTAWKSPSEVIGNPASITSTPISSSISAISSFSSKLMVAPGHCSPSRKVVSNIMTRSLSDLFTLVIGRFL